MSAQGRVVGLWAPSHGSAWPVLTPLCVCTESPARVVAVPERQEERGLADTPSQPGTRAEPPLPHTTAAPSTAPAPRTAAHSPPGTALGDGAVSTGGPEAPNRGG